MTSTADRMFHARFAWLGEYAEGRSGYTTDAKTHARAIELHRWYREDLPKVMQEFANATADRPTIYTSRAEEIKDAKDVEIADVQVRIVWPEIFERPSR